MKSCLPATPAAPAPAVTSEPREQPAPSAQPELTPPPAPEPAVPVIAGQRWAVVIGISAYQDSRIPSLRYAEADGRVTLGEPIPYRSAHVRRETRNAQSPTIAGKFDPALTLGR